MPSGAPDATQGGGDADQQVLGARLGAGQYQMCCVAQDRRSLEGHHIDAADLHPEHGETRGTQRAVQRFRGEGEGLRENALGQQGNTERGDQGALTAAVLQPGEQNYLHHVGQYRDHDRHDRDRVRRCDAEAISAHIRRVGTADEDPPCARLISFRTPNTTDRPSAISAYRPPSSSPFTTASRFIGAPEVSGVLRSAVRAGPGRRSGAAASLQARGGDLELDGRIGRQ